MIEVIPITLPPPPPFIFFLIHIFFLGGESYNGVRIERIKEIKTSVLNRGELEDSYFKK